MNMTFKQKDEIIDILENLPYWDTCPQDYKDRIPELVKALNQVNNGVLDDVNKRAFNVTYLANDEIIKGLTVLADSEEEAMHKALLLRGSKDIYSAIEVNVC